MTRTGSPRGSLQGRGWGAESSPPPPPPPSERGWKVLCWGLRAAPPQDPFSPEGRGAQAEGTDPTEKAPNHRGHLLVGPGPPVSHRTSDHLGSLCFYGYIQVMEVPVDHAWHVFASRKDESPGHRPSSCRARGLGADVYTRACVSTSGSPCVWTKEQGSRRNAAIAQNSSYPAQCWPASRPLIVMNKILMHFIYALMNFIINTINTLILLRYNTSWI